METEQNTVTIGYWPIRGLVQHILYLCHYTGVKYNFVPVTDRAVWTAGKPALIESGFDFPNLPYIQDGDVQLSESLAILLHIAENYGDASLLYTPETRARFFQLWGVISDLNSGFVRIGYGSKSDEDLKEGMTRTGEFNKFRLQSLNAALAGSAWVLGGDSPTILDFFLAEVIEKIQAMVAGTGVNVLEGFDNFAAYTTKFQSLDAIKAYRESDSFPAGPWNNTQAFWK